MGTTPEKPGDAILNRIRESLQRAERRASELRHRNSRLVGAIIVAGALGTLVAGSAAALGPVVAQGPSGWKLTCAIAALLTACATICSGLNQQLSVPDRLARASACAGRLRALEIEMTVSNRDPGEVAKEYEEAADSCQEFMF